jgi:hypothetical protein
MGHDENRPLNCDLMTCHDVKKNRCGKRSKLSALRQQIVEISKRVHFGVQIPRITGYVEMIKGVSCRGFQATLVAANLDCSTWLGGSVALVEMFIQYLLFGPGPYEPALIVR